MNLVDLVNVIAHLWSAHLGLAIGQSTLVAAAVLVVLRFGSRWPAPLRYGLLLVALLKFAVPVTVASPWALFGKLTPALSAPAPERAMRIHGLPPTRVSEPSIPQAHEVSPAAASSTRLTGRAWLLVAFFVGTLAMLVWNAAQLIRLGRLARACTPARDVTLLRLHDRLCHWLRLRRRPRLLVSGRNEGPVAFGLIHPTVVLPEAMVRALDATELRIVLAHELAHHRRGDLWLNLVQAVLSVVWWFDPFYWLVSRRMRSVREECCDDLVLASGVSSGATYCQTLLLAARHALGPLPHSAGMASGSHPLRRRMVRIMEHGFRPRSGLGRWHGALVLTLGLVVLPGASSPRSPRTKAIQAVSTQPAADVEIHFPRASSPRSLRASQVAQLATGIELHRPGLHSLDPRERAEAATAAGRAGDLRALPELVTLLSDETPIAEVPAWDGGWGWSPALQSWQHPSPGEAAAIALASMGEGLTFALIDALNAPNRASRRNAAWALGELRNPRSKGLPEVPPLIRALGDPDPGVRAAAAWALGETKDPRAVRPLVVALGDFDSGTRAQAARALGEIADASSAEALGRALKDSAPDVQAAVSWALNEIRDKAYDASGVRPDH